LSTAAKKARKRAGEKLTKTPKEATPLQERAAYQNASKSEKKRQLESRGITLSARQMELIERQKPPRQPARNFTR
jgi:hypothetical protein